jgi:hypothetical protein
MTKITYIEELNLVRSKAEIFIKELEIKTVKSFDELEKAYIDELIEKNEATESFNYLIASYRKQYIEYFHWMEHSLTNIPFGWDNMTTELAFSLNPIETKIKSLRILLPLNTTVYESIGANDKVTAIVIRNSVIGLNNIEDLKDEQYDNIILPNEIIWKKLSENEIHYFYRTGMTNNDKTISHMIFLKQELMFYEDEKIALLKKNEQIQLAKSETNIKFTWFDFINGDSKQNQIQNNENTILGSKKTKLLLQQYTTALENKIKIELKTKNETLIKPEYITHSIDKGYLYSDGKRVIKSLNETIIALKRHLNSDTNSKTSNKTRDQNSIKTRESGSIYLAKSMISDSEIRLTWEFVKETFSQADRSKYSEKSCKDAIIASNLS